MSTQDNPIGNALLNLLIASLLLGMVVLTCQLAAACLPTEESHEQRPMVTDTTGGGDTPTSRR